MSRESETVRRALAYPYAIPSHSYVLAGVETLSLDAIEVDPSARIPLLAYGSNASPAVLARKLGASTSEEPLLAVRATLSDFDVVYSAHISRYGSIPATLQRSPGTEVAAFVLYLTDEQLRLIEATEPNYERIELNGIACELEVGEPLAGIAAYLSRHGCLTVDGSEVALSAVEARGRIFAELAEPQMLEQAKTLLAPHESIESFVLGNVTDSDLSRARSAQFERHELLLS